MTGVVGPAGSGKSTLIKLMLGRQSRLSGTIAFPADDGRRLFAYLPQRPILFDAPIRDNLFLGETPDDSLARVAGDDSLVRLGLVDLIRLKGLDAPPRGKLDATHDFAKLRAELRAAAEAALGAPLRPLGEGAGAPGQMAIESQLGSAIDHEAFTRYLAGDEARKIVTGLANLDYGRAMEPLALAAMRATAPLLAKANDADEYNAIATCTLDSATFTLRRMALEMVTGGGSRPGGTSPLLVAIAISLKLEELDGSSLPAVEGESRQRLAALAEKFSQPLDERRLNPLLPWRENLLFAALKERNSRDLAAIDHVLLKRLRTTPLDAERDRRRLRLCGRTTGRQAFGRPAADDRPRPGVAFRRSVPGPRRTELGLSSPASPNSDGGVETRIRIAWRDRHHPRLRPRARLRFLDLHPRRRDRWARGVGRSRSARRRFCGLGGGKGDKRMNLADRLSALMSVAEFEGVAPPQRATLAAAMREERFLAGTTIVAEGESADRLFALSAGTVEITQLETPGRIQRLGRGALIGELAFFTRWRAHRDGERRDRLRAALAALCQFPRVFARQSAERAKTLRAAGAKTAGDRIRARRSASGLATKRRAISGRPDAVLSRRQYARGIQGVLHRLVEPSQRMIVEIESIRDRLHEIEVGAVLAKAFARRLRDGDAE